MPFNTPGLGAAEIITIPVKIAGPITTTVTRAARFRLPYATDLIGISANARVVSGTAPTCAVDLQKSTTSAFAAPARVSVLAATATLVAADTLVEASPSAAAGVAQIDDERDLYIDLTVGGTTPSFTDIDINVTLMRRAG